jgi:flagella basal body P-ring formation protein FlgA
MRRKDCGHSADRRANGARCVAYRRRVIGIAGFIVVAATATAHAGSVRLTAEAVVVEDVMRLGALCDLAGFDYETERKLARLVVTEAPEEGSFKEVHIDHIRAALAEAGYNLAQVTLGGAITCKAVRPSRPQPKNPERVHTSGAGERAPAFDMSQPIVQAARAAGNSSDAATSLGEAVVKFFSEELTRFDGRADVVFGQTDSQVLELRSPPFDFIVRRRGGSDLGTVHLEISVLAEGAVVQRIPLTVNARMVREVVVARGPINQEAVIRESDLTTARMTFTRLDRIGLCDPSLVVGQRAKRFIAAGDKIEMELLEQVPLVVRGQLVTLVSSAGGIEVVTTAKAMDSGYLGDGITVRDANDRRRTFDGTIIGPGKVRVGAGRPLADSEKVALGSKG